MILFVRGQEIRYYKHSVSKEVIIVGVETAIRNYLVSHGIKQSFVAEKCGWTKQKVSAIARGKKRILADDYGALCEAIGVPYDYFYSVAGTQDGA